MAIDNPDPSSLGAGPHADLERALITEYLAQRGYDLETVHTLPEADAHALLREASIYASGRLEEVESRAHYVQDIHGDLDARRRSG